MAERRSSDEIQPATELRILLAEDNPVNQKVTATVLERRSHHVDIVENGRLAVAAVERLRYDLVLMDVSMPVMDGLEATRQIRALPGGDSLPILALTAHALDEERERGMAAGMDAYLTKPIRGKQLVEAVERWARPRRDPGRVGEEELADAIGPAATAAGSDDTAAGGGAARTAPVAADEDDGAREPASPPLDLETLRTELAAVGAESALDDVVTAYVDDAPNRIEALAEAAGDGDAEALARAAHTYKSSAGSVGAARLHELLQALEGAAREGRLDDALDLLEQTRAEHSRALDWLTARRPHGGTPGSPEG